MNLSVHFSLFDVFLIKIWNHECCEGFCDFIIIIIDVGDDVFIDRMNSFKLTLRLFCQFKGFFNCQGIFVIIYDLTGIQIDTEFIG